VAEASGREDANPAVTKAKSREPLARKETSDGDNAAGGGEVTKKRLRSRSNASDGNELANNQRNACAGQDKGGSERKSAPNKRKEMATVADATTENHPGNVQPLTAKRPKRHAAKGAPDAPSDVAAPANLSSKANSVGARMPKTASSKGGAEGKIELAELSTLCQMGTSFSDDPALKQTVLAAAHHLGGWKKKPCHDDVLGANVSHLVVSESQPPKRTFKLLSAVVRKCFYTVYDLAPPNDLISCYPTDIGAPCPRRAMSVAPPRSHTIR